VKPFSGHQRFTASGAIQVKGGASSGGGVMWKAITCPERSSGTMPTVASFFVPAGCIPRGDPIMMPDMNTGTGPLAGTKNTAARSPVGRARELTYYMDGWPLQVGVLLDGHRPGQVLGPIPVARPVPGQPEMVNLATGHFPSSLFSRNFGVTAKRVGNAWLVAQGGSGLAQRVQVLNSLRISKLDLHHRAP
jgi:hypothetical protein